ncbi:MAG TPA: Trp biosynthesis-associated membrane protein [Nocardioidaceae bacterium]|nr:Trp biosynthesis-associated membrane protein [Nocardioidaceae bacterium]
MADRRTFWPTVLVGAGVSALAAVGAARPWATASNSAPDAAKGSDVAPLALALALVALASWGAVLVTRLRGRRVASLLGLLASAGAAAVVLLSREEAQDAAEANTIGPAWRASASITEWFYVAGLTSAVAGLLFLAALKWAPGWPEMGTRYDAPKTEQSDQADLWKSLDEGHDPTA